MAPTTGCSIVAVFAPSRLIAMSDQGSFEKRSRAHRRRVYKSHLRIVALQRDE
jgi:hypothetical protein